jgi:hypothetical protein
MAGGIVGVFPCMKCEAQTTAGQPCPANAVNGSRYCASHRRLLGMPGENPPAQRDRNSPPERRWSDEQKETALDPQLSRKEDTPVDEKKNVGFVPGLALLLAALALVLIAINAVKPTPSVEEMEKAMDKKIAAVNESILTVVKNGDLVDKRVARSLFVRDLENLEASIAAMKTTADPTLLADLDVAAKTVATLKAKALLHGEVAAPPPAEDTKGKEKEKKEKK